MAPRKIDFALATRAAITAFAEAVERIGELDSIFVNSEYESDGANEIIAGDLMGHDITVGDLANAHTFAVQLALFLNDGTPMQVDYASKINAFRNM